MSKDVYTIQQTAKKIKIVQAVGGLMAVAGMFVFASEPTPGVLLGLTGFFVFLGGRIAQWWHHE